MMIVTLSDLQKITGTRQTWSKIVKANPDKFKNIKSINKKTKLYKTLFTQNELELFYRFVKNKGGRPPKDSLLKALKDVL